MLAAVASVPPLPPPPLLFLLLFVSSSGASLPLAARCSVLPSRALSACLRRYREWLLEIVPCCGYHARPLSRATRSLRSRASLIVVVEEVPSSSW